MGNMIEIKIPDIGDFKEVEVIEVLVKPGDVVKPEQSLITVESDKASMEIPSVGRGHRQGTEGQARRQGIGRDIGSGARKRRRGCKRRATFSTRACWRERGAETGAGTRTCATTACRRARARRSQGARYRRFQGSRSHRGAGEARRSRDQARAILITVESDKASMEIPSPADGVVESLRVKVGDKVAEGTPVLVLRSEAGSAPASAAAPAPAAPAPASSAPAAAPAPAPTVQQSPESTAFAVEMAARPSVGASDADSASKPHASPSVRRFARELGVDLAGIRGSGPKGRITQDDVQRFREGCDGGRCPSGARRMPAATGGGLGLNLPAWPNVDFAKFGPVEVELSRITRSRVANLHRNWVMIPHVTNNEDADITDLEAFRVQLNARRKSGVKLTMLAFLIKACVAALKKFPEFNSSIDPTATRSSTSTTTTSVSPPTRRTGWSCR